MAHVREELRFGLIGLVCRRLGLLESFDHLLKLLVSMLELGGTREDLLFEPLVGRLQLAVAIVDQRRQLVDLKPDRATELPLAGERGGDLLHFDRVERFAQDQQSVADTEARCDLRPGVICVGCANDDLDLRIGVPDVLDRLESVPPRWHPHIHDGEGVRAAELARHLDLVESLLALIGKIQFERFRRRGADGISE